MMVVGREQALEMLPLGAVVVAVVEIWCVVVVMVMVMRTHILTRYWMVLDPE